MPSLSYLFDNCPSFTSILALREVQDTGPFKDYILSKIEVIESGEETDEEYVAVVRAFRFLKIRRDDELFFKALDLYEGLDHGEDHHEMLSSSLSFYLSEVVSEKHVEFLFERLKKYLGDEENYHEIHHLFELLLDLSFHTDEFLRICIEEFYSPYSDEHLRTILATGYNHPEMLKAVRSRLKHLAPYMKYFSGDERYNQYDSEWHELSHVLFPQPDTHPFVVDLQMDDDFIIEVLGHTDERCSDMIFDRSRRPSANDGDLIRQRDERLSKLKSEFLDPLPENLSHWMKTVPDSIREQFIDFSNRLAKRKARVELLNQAAKRQSSVKVGRNDPCPCGSGKKYKKCHIDSPLDS